MRKTAINQAHLFTGAKLELGAMDENDVRIVHAKELLIVPCVPDDACEQPEPCYLSNRDAFLLYITFCLGDEIPEKLSALNRKRRL